MPYVREAFSQLGDPVLLDGRSIGAADVKDAEILAIRSTTRAGADLLRGSSVRFVGTATIGTDHLDIEYFEQHGIHWCFSPGCNANSVSEYVVCALLCLAERHNFTLAGKTIGVVGVGNVGSRVVQRAKALGLRILQNDPPRARAQESKKLPTEKRTPFVSLQTLLQNSDIITMHVPLTRDGVDPTFHICDQAFFAAMKPHCIFLNTARGPIVDTDALMSTMNHGPVDHVVIDTWEGEPSYRKDLLDLADIATPHIAGHSFEGKVMGTVMVYREACSFLGTESSWSPDSLLPQPTVPQIEKNTAGCSDQSVLHELVGQIYNVEEDDRRLRSFSGDPDCRARHFDSLRKNYPIRREFNCTKLLLGNTSDSLRNSIIQLGFPLEEFNQQTQP